MLYEAARALEILSVRVGWGDFDLGDDTWKCTQCIINTTTSTSPSSSPSSANLCPSCREQRIRELGHHNYSNKFEYRTSVILGIASLVVFFCNWALNVREGWWEMDVAFSVLTDTLHTIPPTLLLPLLRTPLIPLLLYPTLLLSLTTLLATLSIFLFLLCSNPSSARHWRHMTTGMYGVLALQLVLELGFFVWGVGVRDAVFLVGPFVLGITVLMGCAVMDLRRGEEGEDGGRWLEEGLEEGLIVAGEGQRDGKKGERGGEV